MSCSYCGELDDLLSCYECDRFVCKDCIIVIAQFIDRIYCTDCMQDCIDSKPSRKRKRSDE